MGWGWGGGGGQNSIITHPPIPTSTDYDTRFQKEDVHYFRFLCAKNYRCGKKLFQLVWIKTYILITEREVIQSEQRYTYEITNARVSFLKVLGKSVGGYRMEKC